MLALLCDDAGEMSLLLLVRASSGVVAVGVAFVIIFILDDQGRMNDSVLDEIAMLMNQMTQSERNRVMPMNRFRNARFSILNSQRLDQRETNLKPFSLLQSETRMLNPIRHRIISNLLHYWYRNHNQNTTRISNPS